MRCKIIANREITKTSSAAIIGAKTVKLFSGAWDGPYAVASVVIDDLRPDAEVHERAADFWIVRRGSAKFILGGELENSVSPREGEKIAASIVDGKEREVAEGDIIDIPSGVAHQIDARGKRIELIIIKVNGS